MTTNEKQELQVLTIFIENNIYRFNSMEFPKKITDTLGSGANAIVKNLIRDGVITDLMNKEGEYEFNETGRNRYNILKSQKKDEFNKSTIPIIISVIALFVSIYSLWLQSKQK